MLNQIKKFLVSLQAPGRVLVLVNGLLFIIGIALAFIALLMNSILVFFLAGMVVAAGLTLLVVVLQNRSIL